MSALKKNFARNIISPKCGEFFLQTFGGDILQRINVVLVLLNPNNFKSALKSLNFAVANLVAIVVDGGDDKFFNAGKKKFRSCRSRPFNSFWITARNLSGSSAVSLKM